MEMTDKQEVLQQNHRCRLRLRNPDPTVCRARQRQFLVQSLNSYCKKEKMHIQGNVMLESETGKHNFVEVPELWTKKGEKEK